MSGTKGEPGGQGSQRVRVQGLRPPRICPQSEREELTEDGEGSIRSSEEGPGDSGEWRWGPGTGMEHSAGHSLPPHALALPWHF